MAYLRSPASYIPKKIQFLSIYNGFLCNFFLGVGAWAIYSILLKMHRDFIFPITLWFLLVSLQKYYLLYRTCQVGGRVHKATCGKQTPVGFFFLLIYCATFSVFFYITWSSLVHNLNTKRTQTVELFIY